jgi:hypothetical protein
MKKFFLFFILSFSLLEGRSQKMTPIDYDYKDKRVIFPALLKELTKEDKYAVLMPAKLTYHFSQSEIEREIWNPFLNFIEIKAKLHLVKPDYQFQILSPGLQNITPQDVRAFKTSLPDHNGIYRDVRGFVRDYSCNFPLKLVIKNGQGQILHTISISGEKETHTVTLHRDFLQGVTSTIPFASQEEIPTLEANYASAIRKKMEKTIAVELFARMSQSITYLYKNYNTYKLTYGYGFIKSKKGEQSLLPELDKVVNDYKMALDSLSEDNIAGCSQLCQNNTMIMENLLNGNDSRVDKNVKEVLYYNLSHSCLLTNHFEDAWKYYLLFIQSGVSEGSRIATELKGRIMLYQDYNRIKKQLAE